MTKLLGYILLLAASATFAFAVDTYGAPEISASTATSALALVSGGLLILRSRRKR
jgi:hypothetical protein